jgi:hypothetical protein
MRALLDQQQPPRAPWQCRGVDITDHRRYDTKNARIKHFRPGGRKRV